MIAKTPLNSHQALEVLKDQKDLVTILVEDRKASEKKYHQTLKTIEWKDAEKDNAKGLEKSLNNDDLITVSDISSPPPEYKAPEGKATVNADDNEKENAKTPVASRSNSSSIPWGLKYRNEEMQRHGELVQILLAEASAVKYQVEHEFRHKLHHGVLGAYWEQWAPLRKVYGDEALLNALSQYPQVVCSPFHDFPPCLSP